MLRAVFACSPVLRSAFSFVNVYDWVVRTLSVEQNPADGMSAFSTELVVPRLGPRRRAIPYAMYFMCVQT